MIANGGWKREGGRKRFAIFYLLASIFALCSGCRTAAPLPAIDLSGPGWQVSQGQAVWKPAGRPEIAGDLIVATNADGNCFIQFTKNPFAIAMAEVQNGSWEVRFHGEEHAWHGRGRPPARFIWFQLPTALAGGDLNDGWKFEHPSGNLWRLHNPRTGETLAGEFFP